MARAALIRALGSNAPAATEGGVVQAGVCLLPWGAPFYKAGAGKE